MALSAKLSQEIASSLHDPYYRMFNDMPWSEDDTLMYLLGGDYDYYDLILKDAKAKSLLETRDRNTTLREYKVEPASSSAIDKKAADLVREIITAFDFDQMTSDLNVNSYLKGNSFVELMWGIDGKTTYIEEAIARPVHRFKFKLPKNPGKDVGMFRRHEVRLLSTSDLYEGTTVPSKRILCHAYGKKDDNPWGIGLGRVLYWLAVVFKKEIIKQRLVFLDRFAEPSHRGKSPQSATKEQRREFNALIESGRKSGVFTLPHGWELDLMEAGRSTSNDLYQSAIDWCNSEMAQAVLGETLSTELPGSTGSRAAAQTHQQGSAVYLAKFDCDRLSTGPYRELARWITELNYPDAKPPMIWKLFPELEEAENLDSRVNRDNTLNSLGYKITPDKVKEIYGDGYEDLAAKEAQEQKADQDIGLGFSESEESRRAKAFKARLEKAGLVGDTARIQGDVLKEEEFDAIAEITEADIRDAIKNWEAAQPGRIGRLLATGERNARD